MDHLQRFASDYLSRHAGALEETDAGDRSMEYRELQPGRDFAPDKEYAALSRAANVYVSNRDPIVLPPVGRPSPEPVEVALHPARLARLRYEAHAR